MQQNLQKRAIKRMKNRDGKNNNIISCLPFILYREILIRFLRYCSFSNPNSVKLSSNVIKNKATRKHVTAFCSHCNHHRFWLFHHFQQDGIVTRTTRLFLISRDSKLEWKYNRGSLLRHCYLFEASSKLTLSGVMLPREARADLNTGVPSINKSS